MKDLIIKHQKGLRAFALGLQSDLIEYWENRHDPELKYHTGLSTFERAEMEREKLKSMQSDVFPEVSREVFANYLRTQAIDYRDNAITFPDNPWIKWGSLRKVVELLNDLCTVIPELEIYTKDYLSRRTRITIEKP